MAKSELYKHLERKVIYLLLRGYSIQKIAEKLDLSFTKVKDIIAYS